MADFSFISLIKEGLKKSGISLRELSRQVCLDPSYLSKILAGKRTPPCDETVLKSLAQILDLDPIRLIVSTGTIPSEWRQTMGDETVLNELSRYFRGGKFDLPMEYPSIRKGERHPARHHSKTKELSEDLL